MLIVITTRLHKWWWKSLYTRQISIHS